MGQEELAQTMHDETVARIAATTKTVKHAPVRGLTVRGFVAEWLPKRRERGLDWKADEGRQRGERKSREEVGERRGQDGIITYAVRTEQGTTLCLDHPGGWSTQYGELEHVLALSTDRFRRRRKVRVRAGDVLGHVRSLLRIRFGLSRLIDGEWMVIEPAVLIHAWPVLPWFAEPTSCAGSKIAV